MSADILLKNGIVVTVNSKNEVIEKGFCFFWYKNEGYVLIKGEKIVEVGDIKNLKKKKVKKTIDCTGHVIMPGLINTHCHGPMTLFRGYSDDETLEKWLQEHIWPIEGVITKDKKNVTIGAELAVLEMIKSGTTTFIDMYFWMDEVGKVMKKSGMRGLIGEGLLDVAPSPAGTDLKYFQKNVLEKYKNSKLVRPCFAPHSVYTCSEDFLKNLKKLANDAKVKFSIHCSETQFEVDTCKKNHGGKTPVKLLQDLGCLDENTILAHCVHLEPEDFDILKTTKAGISHNISSNMKLSSGQCPLRKLLEFGITKIGLGTDGTSSNNTLNMFEEISHVAKVHKLCDKDPTSIPAMEAVKLGTIGGARALGMEKEIGSLEKGKFADVIILDFNKPHLMPMYNVFSHLCYAVQGSDVEHVIVNGKLLMEKRKVLTMNEKSILTKIRKIQDKIMTERKKLEKK